MRQWVKSILVLGLVAVLVAGTMQQMARAEDVKPLSDAEQAAVQWLGQAFAGDEQADEMLSGSMRDALEAQGGLSAVIASVKATTGELQSFGLPSSEQAGGYTVVVVPLEFESALLNAQVSLDGDGGVAGLYFLPGADDSTVAYAKEIINALITGEYEQVEAVFSQEMIAALEESGGIGKVMEDMLAMTGAFQSYGTATKADAQGYSTVVIPVVFESMTVNASLSIASDGQVIGLLFQPPVEVEDAAVPDGMTEEEVVVDAGSGYPLGGTLCVPDGAEEKLPAVLLVQGSGQNARDEIVGANRVFAQLAHGLAERGIITLRVDKRTYTYPEQWNERGFSVQQEYIEDVLTAVALLQADERVDASSVYILGHSQGGMLAPRFVEAGADVAGLVLMAGTPRNLSDILYDQEMDYLQAVPEGSETEEALRQQYEQWRDEAEALYQMTEEEALDHEGLYDGAYPAYYLYEMAQHDALALLKAQQTPVLIQQGENDWQVFADVDYQMYLQALEGETFAQFKLYEGLNHLFMPSQASDINEAVMEYTVQAEIPAEVMDDIAGFVLALRFEAP